jgi:hypothetical protein
VVIFDEVVFAIAQKSGDGVVDSIFEGIFDEIEVTGGKQQLLLDFVYFGVEVLFLPFVVMFAFHLDLELFPVDKLLLQLFVPNKGRKDVDEYSESDFDAVDLLIFWVCPFDGLEGFSYVWELERPNLFQKHQVNIFFIVLQ